MIAVAGPALVRVREGVKVKEIQVPPNEVYRFTFPPGLSHGIQNTGDQPGVLAAFNSLEHDPGNTDTVHDRLI